MDSAQPKASTTGPTHPATGVLVIGFGNPGWGDDGLGPALAEALREEAPPDVEVRAAFQLAVEHAVEVAAARTVVFVDATVDPREVPFAWRRVDPCPLLDFSSHALTPAGVLGLARELFGAAPDAWLLTIAGTRFDRFGEGISAVGRRRMERAARSLHDFLRSSPAPQAPRPPAEPPACDYP